MFIDLGIVWANIVVIVVALCANGWALTHASPSRRPVYGTTIALCVIYLVSYGVLLGDFPQRVVTWSRVMRGVSLVAWVVVWTIPALYDVKLYRERRNAVEQLIATTDERLKDVK